MRRKNTYNNFYGIADAPAAHTHAKSQLAPAHITHGPAEQSSHSSSLLFFYRCIIIIIIRRGSHVDVLVHHPVIH